MGEEISSIYLQYTLLLNGGPDVGWTAERIVQLFSGCVVSVIGIAGITLFLFRNKFKTWQAIKTMAQTVNIFMEKYMPELLEGFEKNEFVKPGARDRWFKDVARRYYAQAESAMKLNEDGEWLLLESGIKKFIDDALENLMTRLEEKKLTNAVDLEDEAFRVLERKELERDVTRFKNFLYNNPEATIGDISFVGSIYLRDKYLERHPEILDEKTGT